MLQPISLYDGRIEGGKFNGDKSKYSLAIKNRNGNSSVRFVRLVRAENKLKLL